MVTLFKPRHHLADHNEPARTPHAEAVQTPASAHRVGCEPVFSFHGRPGGITIDQDETVYLSDTDSATIWQISIHGSAKPLVSQVSEHGQLHSPGGLALAADGSLVVADAAAHRILSVGRDGSIRVLADGDSGYRDGPAGQAAFRYPRAVAVGDDGTVFVADTGNDRIRQISPDGQVSTVAGSIYDYGDGTGTHARFRRPSGLALAPDGVLYVADTGNNAIRRVRPDGQVTTVAGGPPGGHSDGVGRETGLRWPAGVAVGDDGRLWVADYGNSTVRLIKPTGETSTLFEIPGLGWPTAVAALPGQRAAVAGSALDDRQNRNGCLMVIGDGG